MYTLISMSEISEKSRKLMRTGEWPPCVFTVIHDVQRALLCMCLVFPFLVCVYMYSLQGGPAKVKPTYNFAGNI